MKKPRETVAWVCVFSILIMGCYTQSPVTKEEGAPDDKKVFFYLKDGSYIESFADNHRRVEGGYQVSGTVLKRGNNPVKFDGLVLDNDIDRLGVIEISEVDSLLALAGVAAAVLVIMVAEGLSSFR